MASPAGRGAQVRLEGVAQAAARGAIARDMDANVLAKRVLEVAGTVADGDTRDGSTRAGVAAEDEVLAPGGVFDASSAALASQAARITSLETQLAALLPPDYYVDPVAGSDANGGLAAGSAFATLSKAASTAPAGKRIGLKRGATFREFVTIQQDNQEWVAYGDGAKPIITGFNLLTGATEVIDNIAGPNRVLNSSFATTASWTLDTGVSITGGQLVLTNTGNFPTAIGALSQPFVAGESYTITYTVVSGAPSFFVLANQGVGNAHVDLTTNPGVNTVTWVFGNTNFSGLYIRCQNAGITLDNVTVTKNPSGLGTGIYSKAAVTTQPLTATYTKAGVTTLLGLATTQTAPALNQFGWVANTVYVNVGENPSAGVLEIGQRPYALYTGNKSGLRFRDIRFTGANGFGYFDYSSTAALVGNTMDRCEAAYCRQDGARTGHGHATLRNTGARWRNCLFERNGACGGIFQAGTNDAQMIDCEAHHNTWDPAAQYTAGLRVWGDAENLTGTYAAGNSGLDVKFIRCNSHDNALTNANLWGNGWGIHVDEVRSGCSVEDCITSNNGSGGIFVEHSYKGAVQVLRNTASGNGFGTVLSCGILIYRGCIGAVVTSNVLTGNNVGLGSIGEAPTTQSDNVFTLNISTGNGRQLWAQSGGDNNGTNGSGNVYDYNTWGPDGTNMIRWGTGTDYSTKAAWRVVSVQGAHDL